MTNCCDDYGNCNQGRDCPIRNTETRPHRFGSSYDARKYPDAFVKPAAVAKIGKRMHGQRPLPTSLWHVYLGSLARAMLLCLAVIMVSAVTVAIMTRT